MFSSPLGVQSYNVSFCGWWLFLKKNAQPYSAQGLNYFVVAEGLWILSPPPLGKARDKKWMSEFGFEPAASQSWRAGYLVHHLEAKARRRTWLSYLGSNLHLLILESWILSSLPGWGGEGEFGFEPAASWSWRAGHVVHHQGEGENVPVWIWIQTWSSLIPEHSVCTTHLAALHPECLFLCTLYDNACFCALRVTIPAFVHDVAACDNTCFCARCGCVWQYLLLCTMWMRVTIPAFVRCVWQYLFLCAACDSACFCALRVTMPVFVRCVWQCLFLCAACDNACFCALRVTGSQRWTSCLHPSCSWTRCCSTTAPTRSSSPTSVSTPTWTPGFAS